MKKLIFLLLIMILGKFAFAVVNVHQPGSAQWHAQNQMWAGQAAQLEHDRRMAEQKAAAQRAAQQYQDYLYNYDYYENQKYEDKAWSVFVWNDKTGNAYYLSNEWILKKQQKALIKKAQKIFLEVHGEKPNQYLYWDGGLAVIMMGIDKNTGKIVAFVDNDFVSWAKKYGEDSDMREKVKRDSLERCSAEAYNCEVMYLFE